MNDTDAAAQCTVIDMGYWEWKPFSASGQAASGEVPDDDDPQQGGQAASKVMHLVQFVATPIAPRVLLFPWPFDGGESWDKLSPGFFDAPGEGRPCSRNSHHFEF